jgi:hypothetical protein
MKALKNLCTPFQAKEKIRKGAAFQHPDPHPMVSSRIGIGLQQPVDDARAALAWPLASVLRVMYRRDPAFQKREQG